MEVLKAKLDDVNYRKLMQIKNQKLHDFVAEYIELCNPDKVYIRTDSEEDIDHIRKEAIRRGEEQELAIEGHTIHFEGYHDQARDREHTKILTSPEVDLGPLIRTTDREEGVREVREILKDSMKNKTMYVVFSNLGPLNSKHSIPAVQLTDSCYVGHSEHLLYRPGYEEFRKIGSSERFFRFVHCTCELDYSKRRIYMDVEDGITYSTNTEYGGNTIGLKKLALRLAIYLASGEGWLAEHMFVMGVKGLKRKTYFTGAYPSACGKTSTSMMEGVTIIGDDLVYLKKKDGDVYAINPERGIFGIIQGVNSEEEPIIWEALTNPGEVIFSNVLLTEDRGVYWLGKDGVMPEKGFNHSGEWYKGKKDSQGNEITPSHKNARFTFDMKLLRNRDEKLDHPEGVKISGIVYGGRDSDTSVPVQEAFDWTHGIITMGAALESETTAATLGKEGVRYFNPMSNLDFVSIPLAEYIKINLDFPRDLKNTPLIYSVNYFLKDSEGEFLNSKLDKLVWFRWMELRVHGEVDAIDTPTGRIPKYDDLRKLFREVLGREYTREEYSEQFTTRVTENLEKIKRIVNIYKKDIDDTPILLFEELEKQRTRLSDARDKYGDYISPDKLG